MKLDAGAVRSGAGEVLVERDVALEQIGGLLELVVAGRGSVVVVEGPAGIGKSAVLAAAGDVARTRGVRVLTATAAETERAFAFGVVRQLLEPVARQAEPAEHDRLFEGAAAVTRPLITGAAVEGSGTPMDALLHGLYWVVAGLAESRPLLVSVDDAHWADGPSLHFLGHLGRRIADLPVLLVVARRPHDPGVERDAGALLDVPQAQTRVELLPLTDSAVAQVARRVLGQEPDERFVRACCDATGGNPFLLVALVRELARAGVPPVAGALGRIGEVRPASVTRAVRRHLARLPPEAIAVAEAVAVLERASFEAVAALAGVPRDAADAAVDALVQAELLRVDGDVSFAHPMQRAAVYDGIAPRERVRRHAAAAWTLADLGAEPETVAAHLLRTDVPLDPEDVDRLRRAAGQALTRGSPDTAAEYLRRAVAPGAPAPGFDVLLQLGRAELFAAQPQAAQTLEAAVAAAGAPRAVAEASRLLSLAYLNARRYDDAVEVLQRAIEAIGDTDRDVMLRLEGELAGVVIKTRGQAAASRIERFADVPGETPGERLVLAAVVYRRGLRSEGWDTMADLARRALAGGLLLDEQETEGPAQVAVRVLLQTEHFGEADALIAHEQELAAARGSAVSFIYAALNAAFSASVQGDVRAAEADAENAYRVARDIGWVGLATAVGHYVHVKVERGDLGGAETALAATGMYAGAPSEPVFAATLLVPRAQLRLAQHRPDDALADITQVARHEDRHGHVAHSRLSNWRPPAVRTLLALDRPGDALDVAQSDLALARRRGADRPIGVALHHLALARDSTEGLEEAVAVLELARAPFELAHALVDLGAALRRSRRLVDAREPLSRAIDLARECGAGALERRAEEEMAATGVRRRRGRSHADDLTPAERRTAALAAEGLTNKQIAQALFVTLKTVESQLSSAYRRLGVASRGELAGALTRRRDSHRGGQA